MSIKPIKQLKLAIEPIYCFKIVMYNLDTNTIFSPYQQGELKWGMNFPEKLNTSDMEYMWQLLISGEVTSCFIHSYKTKNIAMHELINNEERLEFTFNEARSNSSLFIATIVEATIPQGACYFENSEEYASTSLFIENRK